MLPPTVEDPCPHFCPPHGDRKRANTELTGWGAPLPAHSSTTWCPPPQGLGGTSPVPSVVAVGVMRFLHAEGLRLMSLGKWEERPGGQGEQSQKHRHHFIGRAAPEAGEESAKRRAGGRQEGEGGLLAITAAVPSGWRSLPRPQPSVRTQTGPVGAQQGA